MDAATIKDFVEGLDVSESVKDELRAIFAVQSITMKYSEYIYEKAFQFEDGTLFRGLKIAYHTSEREYRPGDKVVWVCHALTANSNPEEWWPQLVGQQDRKPYLHHRPQSSHVRFSSENEERDHGVSGR